MKIAAQNPAPRSDSTIDTHLDPAQAEALAHRLDCGMSLVEAADFLLEEHGLKLSQPSISRWAARRRRGKSETTFARFTEAVKNATAPGMNAALLDKQGLHGAVEINALMLNQLIYAAGTAGDAYGMMHAAKVFAHLLGTATRARRADTSRVAAETARLKFEFNAAKAAIQHAEALHKISKECQEDEDAKMVRAIARMFGRRPTPSEVPLTEWEQRIDDAAREIEQEEAKAKAEGKGQDAEVEKEDAKRRMGDGAECRARAAEQERERMAEEEPALTEAPAPIPAAPPVLSAQEIETAEYQKKMIARAERQAEQRRRRPLPQAPPKPEGPDEMDAFLDRSARTWWRPKF